MLRIETEKDWSICEEPDLVMRQCHERTDNCRFRFLALNWGLRLCNLLNENQSQIQNFTAFEQWMSLGDLDAPISFEPLFQALVSWASFAPDPFVESYIGLVTQKRFLHASISAGLAASLNHPLGRFMPDHTQLKSKRKQKAREDDENRRREQYSKDREAFALKVRREFCNEFRDVAGNPFRPVTFDPAWRTTHVLDLAQTINREQKYDQLPILADVLEEAGCSNADILNHCRTNTRHVKGCWVVDLANGVIDSTSGVSRV